MFAQLRQEEERLAQEWKKKEEQRKAQKQKEMNEWVMRELEKIENEEREAELRDKKAREEEENERQQKDESEWQSSLASAALSIAELNVPIIVNEDSLQREGYAINRAIIVANGHISKIYGAKNAAQKEILCKVITLSDVKSKKVDRIREAGRILAYLRSNNHQNVLTVWAVFESKEHKFYTFMETLQGSLKNNKESKQPEAVVKKWAKNIVDGLYFLHSKAIAHRHITPDNLLVDDEDNIKIGGFSSACVYFDPISRTVVKLSPAGDYHHHYSPERITRDYNPAVADIFNLGIIIIYMLTKKWPFELGGPDASDYPVFIQWKLCLAVEKVEISEELTDLLQNVLKADPEKRVNIKNVVSHKWLAS
ncbi:serine/threonine protein kinase-like protein [Dinothrombium tinctorium]|uniref:Serine/threonine protein kinase-like protein n=1 Tax=Dinothrombium tinctorium TaxID=1965070 RepID=A0A3S3PIJ5_9ACAR|nr:serine/threonine protein kinase-like protein [Dinothrombium tinctorium]RWS15934.1 serine/threonine protein kinase-like protein [Dinothrombium tinctorium]